MKPHKHAELIKMIADNIDIEIQANCGLGLNWIDISVKKFFNIMNEDCWNFRIKPEPKPEIVRWKWAVKNGFNVWYETPYFLTDEEAKNHFHKQEEEDYKKLNYTKTTFDGETGELQSAEVLK